MKISQKTNLNSEMEVIKVANKNEDLRKANKAKKDEFYTQLSDIEK